MQLWERSRCCYGNGTGARGEKNRAIGKNGRRGKATVAELWKGKSRLPSQLRTQAQQDNLEHVLHTTATQPDIACSEHEQNIAQLS